jgi:hypothetical protein
MAINQSLRDAFDQKFNKKSGGDGNQDWKLFYRFWKMDFDEIATIRFVPDKNQDNPLKFILEVLQHELYINGRRERIICPSQVGEACPICELSNKFYAEKNDEMGSKYYRKRNYLANCVVVDSPVEHDQNQLVKLIEFGPAIFKMVLDGLRSGDLDNDPQDYKGGHNFRIKKTKNGQYASYATSSFSPKPSDFDDDMIAEIENNLYNLEEYRGQILDYATIEAMLIASQTGDAPKASSAPKANNEPVVEKVENKVEEAAPLTSGKNSSILAKLRERAEATGA